MSGFDGNDVSGTMGEVVKLVDNFDSLYQYVTNEGRTFWFRSNMDAPKYKVISMQLPPVGSPMEEDDAALAQIPKVRTVLRNYYLRPVVRGCSWWCCWRCCGGDDLLLVL